MDNTIYTYVKLTKDSSNLSGFRQHPGSTEYNFKIKVDLINEEDYLNYKKSNKVLYISPQDWYDYCGYYYMENDNILYLKIGPLENIKTGHIGKETLNEIKSLIRDKKLSNILENE